MIAFSKKSVYRRTFTDDRPQLVEVFLAISESHKLRSLYFPISKRKPDKVIPLSGFLVMYRTLNGRVIQLACASYQLCIVFLTQNTTCRDITRLVIGIAKLADSDSLALEACANCPSPMYTPAWEIPLPLVLKNTKSPTRRSSRSTCSPALAWLWEVRGRSISKFLNMYSINPEQSNPLVVVPPHLYGVPTNCFT